MDDHIPVSTFLAHQWLCDHFGHLNVRHYAAGFDDAVFHFWAGCGIVIPREGESGVIPVTARLTVEFHSEIVAGSAMRIFARILRIGQKSVTIRFEMRETHSALLAASCETVEVFFDAIARESRAIPDDIRAALTKMTAVQTI